MITIAFSGCFNYEDNITKNQDKEAIMPNISTKIDPEMKEAMEQMDKMAGIDKKSVIDNLGEGGTELIGSWGFKQKDGNIDIRLVLNSDGTYKRYKKYPDENSILTGTWSYNENRILKLHTTEGIENGRDIMSEVVEYMQYEIYYFKDNTIKLMNVASLNQSVYSKVIK
jgi:hypothetical protein